MCLALVVNLFKEIKEWLYHQLNTKETNIKDLILTRTGTRFPTVGHIVLMSQLLCYFKLNFVNLILVLKFNIKYLLNLFWVKAKLKKASNFFLEYDGSNEIEGHEEIVMYFQLIEK